MSKSKFHSTVSRRDFMKGFGLGVAGVGAAAASAPVVHDLDELISSDKAIRPRAWYIKEVDHPTVEIDWSLVHRHHGFHSAQSGAMVSRYLPNGPSDYSALSSQGGEAELAARQSNDPGLNLRDKALQNGSHREVSYHGKWSSNFRTATNAAFLGPRRAATPEELGVPKWQGTPEENTRMLRAAMRFYGASEVGMSEMDAHHKELIGLYGDNISQRYWPFGSSPNWPPPEHVIRPMRFYDGTEAYCDEENSVMYYPNNVQLHSVTYLIPQSNELQRTAPKSNLYGASNSARYRMCGVIRPNAQDFLWGLGYQSMADTPYRGIPSAAGACLSGLTENSRHHNIAISPEHGSTVGIFDIMTDLPLEPTKAVDAGIWNFCHTCGVCADTCPSGAITKKGEAEPSWEPGPSAITPYYPPLPGLGFDPPSPGESEYAKLGRKTYWTDMPTCRIYSNAQPSRCNLCMGVCTFNSQNDAMIHEIVRATAGTTGIFNSFFASMHKTFGYGLKEGEEKEDWWEMELPSFGYSTTVGAKHGGY